MLPQDIPADLILSIEYLDYAREAHPRPGVDLMSADLRSLHSISCLLANMPAIVNPAVGRAAAARSCEELNLCILGLRNEVSWVAVVVAVVVVLSICCILLLLLLVLCYGSCCCRYILLLRVCSVLVLTAHTHTHTPPKPNTIYIYICLRGGRKTSS